MISFETVLLVVSLLLLISIVGSQALGRAGVPALLFFLALGMLAGEDGPGGIYFDDYSLAQSLGVVALALILFSGSLDTNWRVVRPVLGMGMVLATAGVALTALVTAGFATLVLGFPWLEGLLLGSIVSSTDAAAVFAAMRSKNARLQQPLEPLLELESGSNDPMAVFLTVTTISIMMTPGASMLTFGVAFVRQMVVGGILGYLLGRGMVWLVNRVRLGYDGLYPVLTLALALFAYSATALVGGNGFLAVYFAGMVMGNSEFIHRRSLLRFHDGVAWLMQIAMFLTLGLLVFPSQLPGVSLHALLLSLVLIFVARPISVFLSLIPFRLSLREKTLVSWVGLRGAVPIILATFPTQAGVPGADAIFNLVFFIVLTSVLLQGPTIPLIARWLKVDAPAPAQPKYSLEFETTVRTDSQLVEFRIPPDSAAVGKQIVDLHLPEKALVVLINRGEDFVVPRGGTVIEGGDTLLVLADSEAQEATRPILENHGAAAEFEV